MAPHSSTLAWKIPWTGKPGRLQSMGSLGVGHDWATSLSLFIFMHWRRKWQPTPVFLLENPRGGGAWWAAVYGVAQSRTRLKELSSSSIVNKSPKCSTWVQSQKWQNDLVHVQDKACNITVIQVYAPTTNVEETEVEWFYEDLQDLLQLSPKKKKKSSLHYREL